MVATDQGPFDEVSRRQSAFSQNYFFSSLGHSRSFETGPRYLRHTKLRQDVQNVLSRPNRGVTYLFKKRRRRHHRFVRGRIERSNPRGGCPPVHPRIAHLRARLRFFSRASRCSRAPRGVFLDVWHGSGTEDSGRSAIQTPLIIASRLLRLGPRIP